MTAARWLPGGGRLAVAHGAEVRILEFPSGREWLRVAAPGVLQLAVSADGRWLGLGGLEPKLWEPATGRLLVLPRVPDRPTDMEQIKSDALPRMAGVVLLEFARDGRHVLLSGRGWRGTCTLDEPERFAAAPVDCASVNELGFLGAGERFVAQSPRTRLRTFDSSTGAIVREFSLQQNSPYLPRRADQPSPDGHILTRQGAPAVDLATGGELGFPIHQSNYFTQDFSEDGRLLVSASVDDTVRLWTLPGGGRSQLVGWHQEGAISVSISPDQRFVATGQFGGGGLVRIWRLRRAPEVRTLPLEGSSRLAVSDDEQWLLPAGWTDIESALDRTRAYRIGSWEAGPELVPGGLILGGTFAPDRSWLALAVSGSTAEERKAQIGAGDAGAGNVQFWDFRTGGRLGPPVALPVEPRAVAVHPGGRLIGILGAGRSLFEFDRDTGELRQLQAPGRFQQPHEALNAHCRYSPDGRILLATGRGFAPLLFLSGTTQRVPAPHLQDLRVISSALHDSVLATGTMDGQIDFTQLPDGRRAGERIEDSNWLLLTQFDAAGDWLLTGGRNRAMRVYDWRRRQLAGPAMIHDGEVYGASFRRGTTQVVTGELGAGGRIQFWEARLGQPVRPPWIVGPEFEELRLLADGTLLVTRTRSPAEAAGIDVRNITELLTPPALPPEEALALAEIDAAAIIQNGGLEPLSAHEWLRRWREFRARRPGWHAW